MPNKNEHTYSKVLSVLKDHLPGVNVKRMMVDFECSFINSFKMCFPGVDVSGCFFHHSQCLWRHVESSHLQKQYNTDVRFALNIRMLMATAFVPRKDVCVAFEELVQSNYYVENEVVLEPVVTYFESTWIGILSRSGKRRMKPYFSHKLWNCHDAVIQDLVKTNNSLEGWHNSFNRKVRINHLSLTKYISVIKTEQSITECMLVQMNTGMPVAAKKKRVYVDIDLRIKNIVINYDSAKKLQFLHDIAAVLSI